MLDLIRRKKISRNKPLHEGQGTMNQRKRVHVSMVIRKHTLRHCFYLLLRCLTDFLHEPPNANCCQGQSTPARRALPSQIRGLLLDGSMECGNMQKGMEILLFRTFLRHFFSAACFRRMECNVARIPDLYLYLYTTYTIRVCKHCCK